ncbi:bacteriohemerythrin [Chitinibacter bivalviorum]|uniref:Bacteriohemerythrin n=1 Tax=Chitinibacter bivalviorum TaxID=2739434 RepID=A0A7H9BLP6_9NEIS|nr:bacteriohemerythrin [Chitinibacter bivalviorum]QLG89369.1 bacteriohemerythrin [Chitinibacter bivalviorum]
MSLLIEWNDALSVGIQEIDEQHKVLVNLLNELHDAIRQHHGREASVAILQRLADYTRIHFTVEESLMRILGYPDYEAHKGHHEDLIAQMNDLQERLNKGEAISFELLHFLRNWLTNHIMEGDQRYVEHFLSRGAQKSWHKKSWLERFWS